MRAWLCLATSTLLAACQSPELGDTIAIADTAIQRSQGTQSSLGFTVSGRADFLLVAVTHSFQGDPADVVLSEVTYGGDTLEVIHTETHPAGLRTTLQALQLPARGTADIVVTSNVANPMLMLVASFIGVDPDSPIGEGRGNQGDDGTPVVVLQPENGDFVIGVIAALGGGADAAISAPPGAVSGTSGPSENDVTATLVAPFVSTAPVSIELPATLASPRPWVIAAGSVVHLPL